MLVLVLVARTVEVFRTVLELLGILRCRPDKRRRLELNIFLSVVVLSINRYGRLEDSLYRSTDDYYSWSR